MPAYYNEFDPYAAEWLRARIAAGQIPAGDVDTRSIVDVCPEDLRGYDQCHFFAGIGIWASALRRIRWPDDAPIWTGSCPCQPFSAAGRGAGFADERHLWPAWFHLIAQCGPAVVVGEQVASKDGLGWFDLVSADLEGAGYAVGAADLCAAGFGVESWRESRQAERLRRAIHDCPDIMVAAQLADFAAFANASLSAPGTASHIRQRLYFVGMADAAGESAAGPRGGRCVENCSDPSGVDDSASARHVGSVGGAESDPRYETRLRVPSTGRAVSGVGDPSSRGFGVGGYAVESGGGRHVDGTSDRVSGVADAGMCKPEQLTGVGAGSDREVSGRPSSRAAGYGDASERPGALPIRRGDVDWLLCRDGKWRAVEPLSFPLANAVPARVGKLRAYGNALDEETVVAFLSAALDTT